MAFNFFVSPTKDDIRVGYISPTLGYVDGITICEANNYAKNNPGTVFIFRDGNNNLRYLNINEVNSLGPNDLRGKTDECGGVQNYKECGPPTIQFFGGGGIGAVGNPIIGIDGSLLAIDLVSGGHGYQYPPIVSAKDSCEIGNGAILTAVLGETADQTEVYEGEEDFEEYEICEDDDGYGTLYGSNGEILGPWDPSGYIKIGEDPIQREVEAFQEALKSPFWTTREDQPTRVIVSDRNFATQETVEVTHPEWGEFMNKYAVSPVSPSDTIGSDNAGKTYRMEWEFNFPISGEYIFRGVCDNIAEVFIDGASIGSLKGFADSPSPLKKTIQEGNHIVRVDLLNVPITEIINGPNDPGEVEATFKVTGEGRNTNLMKFSFSSGGDTFTIKGNDKGKQTREVKVKLKPNSKYKIIGSSSKGPIEQGIIQNGTKNKEGGAGSSNKIFADHIDSNNDNDDIQISTNIGTFVASNKRQGEDGRSTFDLVLEVPAGAVEEPNTTQVISPKSWNTNPMGVSMIIDAPKPPVPQEPLPPAVGECPPNPIWTTRFPGASEQWYPVKNERWAKFFNRYGISPVLPLDTPGSDSGGVVYRNSWDVEIPYRGFYNFVAQRDATARIYVDGKLAFDVKSAGDQKWIQEGLVGKVKSQKVLIEKGRHTISVEVENEVIGTRSVIDAKIFSTQDWRTSTTSTPDEVDVKFKISEAGSDGSSIEISNILTANENKDGENITKKIEIGKVYNVKASPSNRKLKSDGSILRLEDSDDNDFNDLVIRASQGKFYDVSDNTAKFIVENTKSPSPISISKNGVTYSGPELFGYTETRWSKYMNDFSVSPKVDNNIGTFTLTWANVSFPYNGTYKFNFQADNIAKLTIGGTEILQVSDFIGEKVQYNFNITAGTYDIVIELQNLTAGGDDDKIFEKNPMGVALYISKDVVFTDNNKTSWEDNPMGIAAILVPPPCAKRIGGKGVVIDVEIDDPGNGYLRPRNPESDYNVVLVLDDVKVKNPGINYNCGEDQIVITPSNGAELSYSCDSFGRISSVNVTNPGIGFRVYPEIKIVSPTGVNATFTPVFRVVRDPITAPEETLIQVTDLVGLKQTGYVDGRAYYGAIYYDEGIPYAGFYKTVGPQTRVYATLQESITAQVTTQPSAIQRSGTDIRSNDPRLNIPGTPGSIE